MKMMSNSKIRVVSQCVENLEHDIFINKIKYSEGRNKTPDASFVLINVIFLHY